MYIIINSVKKNIKKYLQIHIQDQFSLLLPKCNRWNPFDIETINTIFGNGF